MNENRLYPEAELAVARADLLECRGLRDAAHHTINELEIVIEESHAENEVNRWRRKAAELKLRRTLEENKELKRLVRSMQGVRYFGLEDRILEDDIVTAGAMALGDYNEDEWPPTDTEDPNGLYEENLKAQAKSVLSVVYPTITKPAKPAKTNDGCVYHHEDLME